ncbi:MAG: hypothetical protein RBT76_15400 [candidate division Zixibacteria bacterium]|jgi:hypothetical protein|nr:hypothetical protein [candidate division Zixibacteria bacterium]
MSTFSPFELWIMAFVTLAIFSFLYRDNPVYRLVESIFAGLSAGYYFGLMWDTVLMQQVVYPIRTDGAWYLLIPTALGVLLFSRLTRSYSYLSRVPLAFVIGSTSGVFITSRLQGLVLPQIRTTFMPQNIPGGSTDPGMIVVLSAIVVIGVIATLIYFYFSHEHKGALGVTAKVGIWFIMISFGAHFGYTVMGRVSLLIGRVQFLVESWIGSFTS